MLKARLLRDCIVSPPEGPEGACRELLVTGYEIWGHAGFDEYGRDVVCAGVSAIAQAALLGLRDSLGKRVTFEKRSGYLKVHVAREHAGKPGPRAIFRALELGLKAIAQSYPGALAVDEEGGERYDVHGSAAFCTEKGYGKLEERS